VKDFSGKRALVTGGVGLIGSAVARKLVAAGCSVTIIDNLDPEGGGNRKNIEDCDDRLEVICGDIRDKEVIADLLEGQDFLFHLAAQTSHVGSMRAPLFDLDNNVTATVQILEVARKVAPDIQIVFSSTRQVFGPADYLPVDERHPVRPPDVNAINKIAAEQYLALYNRIYGVRSTSLRLTNIYGPGMRVKDAAQNFLGIWIKQVLDGEKIRIFGDGRQIRDFVFVDDCADLMLKVARKRPAVNACYLVGGGQPARLIDLAETLVHLSGRGSFELTPFPPERSAIDIGDFFGLHERVSAEFDWQPETTLEKGLQATLDYYRSRLPDYR
jgi:UDP-glucose 4-epimerase